MPKDQAQRIADRLYRFSADGPAQNPDDDLQRLRRQAALGDPMAIQRLARAEGRVETGFTWTPGTVRMKIRHTGPDKGYDRDRVAHLRTEIAGLKRRIAYWRGRVDGPFGPSTADHLTTQLKGYQTQLKAENAKRGRTSHRGTDFQGIVAGPWAVVSLGQGNGSPIIVHRKIGQAVATAATEAQARHAVETYLLPTGFLFEAKTAKDVAKWSAEEALAFVKARLSVIQDRAVRARVQRQLAGELYKRYSDPAKRPWKNGGELIAMLDTVPWPLGLDGELD